ncbi:F0F1 ATP synthase subunit A [uncultured Clostridium sp.]|jgi:F-type H+-transporting ATPase subunit a|uniref:F0F1 ATP synthase subunit A n=1 Tax=uncultured Clostridium sp. TaxID=59620 RepID=UPI0026111DAB|nr:F0F1 ATP synthase subunit A [uncultured Clostridium sp.]
MHIFAPQFTVTLGSFVLPSYLIMQWAVMLLIIILAGIVTAKLNMKPGKLQAVAEMFYEAVEKLVSGNIGKEGAVFIPFIGTLMIYILLLNYVGLIGIAPPTNNLNITGAFAIVVVLVVHGNAIRKNGILGYLKGYASHGIAMIPLNLMEKVIFPVSLALRLFGNMLAAGIVLELVYEGLSHFAWAAQIGLPIIAHGFFDVFDGTIQMIVFVMLTVINIKITAQSH